MDKERFVMGPITWDIEKAMTIVADGRDSVEIDIADCLRVLGAPSRFIEEIGTRRFDPNGRKEGFTEFGRWITASHVANVNPNRPGILGIFSGQLTIFDGHHRVVHRWLRFQDTMPFYVLTQAESDTCLVPGK